MNSQDSQYFHLKNYKIEGKSYVIRTMGRKVSNLPIYIKKQDQIKTCS